MTLNSSIIISVNLLVVTLLIVVVGIIEIC